MSALVSYCLIIIYFLRSFLFVMISFKNELAGDKYSRTKVVQGYQFISEGVHYPSRVIHQRAMEAAMNRSCTRFFAKLTCGL
jgi:hypothetical protein